MDQTDYLRSTEASRQSPERAMTSTSYHSFSIEAVEAIRKKLRIGEKGDGERHKIASE